MSGRKTAPDRSTVDDAASSAPSPHAVCVDAWLEQCGESLAPDTLLRLFEAAFGALWARTATTLGEVTLMAIAERVLYNGAETFPLFSSLKIEPNGGIPFRALRKRIGSAHDAELLTGVRFVLVEFLTVLGNLTADILTPELHVELSRVALPDSVRPEAGSAPTPGFPTDPEEDIDGEHETS